MSTIKIKQVRSKIGIPADQKRTFDALRLHRSNRAIEHEYAPLILGMVDRTKRLATAVK